MPEEDLSFKKLFIPFTKVKAIIFILLIGFTVYFNSLLNGFIGDDNGQILTNPLVHSLGNFFLFFKGSTLYIEEVGKSAGLYYRPLMSLSFATLYSFFGPTPFFFHFFQLSLHIINSILLFLIFCRVTSHKALAFTLALIFLLHPINNETVVYISNIQEVLFAFFGLLALIFVNHSKNYVIVPLLLFFSLLSKETGVIFIPLVVLYFLYSPQSHKKEKRQITYLLSSLVGVSVLYVLIRIFIGNTGLNTGHLYMSTHASLWERLLTLPSIYFYYIKQLFFPYEIAFGWYWVIKTVSISNFWIPLLVSTLFFVVILIPIIPLRKYKTSQKIYSFFLILFILNLLFISQIFPLDLTVADRWFYMPLIGLLGMLGIVIKEYGLRFLQKKSLRIATICLVTVILLPFSIRDIIRTSNWTNNYELCNHDVKTNTQSYILEFCVSNELLNLKKYHEAKIHAKRALDLYPQYFLSWYTLGKIQYALGEKEDAKVSFQKTLEYNDFALGSRELALLYVYDKKPNEAKKVINRYLNTMPNSGDLWYALALAEYLEGNRNEAVKAAEKAYKLLPNEIIYKVYYRLNNNLPITF